MLCFVRCWQQQKLVLHRVDKNDFYDFLDRLSDFATSVLAIQIGLQMSIFEERLSKSYLRF